VLHQDRPQGRRRRLREEAWHGDAAHDGGIARMAEHGEGHRRAGDRLDPDARAVEEEGGGDDAKPEPQHPDARRDKERGSQHGPERMVIAANQHFDGPRGDLRGTDEGTEGDGRRERDVAQLKNGQEMDGDDRRDHRTHRDGARHQDKDSPRSRGRGRRAIEGLCALTGDADRPALFRFIRDEKEVERQSDE